MKHPGEQDLALFASGDTAWWRTFRVRRHVNRCEACQERVEEYQAVPLYLEVAREVPDAHWNELAAEMRANIRLGVEAGECIAPAPAEAHQGIGWKPAVAFASICLLILSGWLIYFPRFRSEKTAIPAKVVLGASESGIEVRQDGRGLALMHEGAESVTLTASTEGVITARYVDNETGNVTISHVYAE